MVQGGRKKGRQKKRWEDNISEWTGLGLSEAIKNKNKNKNSLLSTYIEIHWKLTFSAQKVETCKFELN